MTIAELIEHVSPFNPERTVWVKKDGENVEWLHNNKEGYTPFLVSEILTWDDVAETKTVKTKTVKTKGGE